MRQTLVTLLPREMRMVVERILLLTALPAGSVPAVRDVVLYSAAAGLGGLPLLQRRFADLGAVDLARIRIADLAPGHLTVEAGDQHAWMVLPLLLDALGEAVATHGKAQATISNLLDGEELQTAYAMGPRTGLTVCVNTEAGNAALTLTARAAIDKTDATLARVLRDGVVVEPALWWALHDLSNTSLSPDTPESRRHAGPVIVEADGRVIGRSDHDDDTDLSLLTEAAPSVATKHEAA